MHFGYDKFQKNCIKLKCNEITLFNIWYVYRPMADFDEMINLNTKKIKGKKRKDFDVNTLNLMSGIHSSARHLHIGKPQCFWCRILNEHIFNWNISLFISLRYSRYQLYVKWCPFQFYVSHFVWFFFHFHNSFNFICINVIFVRFSYSFCYFHTFCHSNHAMQPPAMMKDERDKIVN